MAQTPIPEVELLNVSVDLIDEGERFRKDYGNIEELGGSITNHGLISPLAVMRQEGEKPFKLLAGGRRLRALITRKATTAPVRVFPSTINELEQRSIELAENFYRKDLDFREHLKLTAKIHQLMVELHGQR
jgi:ParB/RepB/Spo0J family partition protein